MASSGVLPWLAGGAENIADWTKNAVAGIPSVLSQIPEAAKQIVTGQPTLPVTGPAIESAIGHALLSSPPAPTPKPGGTTTYTETSPSFQQLAQAALAPAIRDLGKNLPNGGAAAAVSIPYSEPGAGTVGQNISSTMQSMVKDYQAGLNAMLGQVGTAQPAQSVLKGMESLLAYPASFTGLEGAPASIAQTPFLQTLYESLNAQRNPTTMNPVGTTSTSNTSGYNSSSINSLLGGQ